MDVGALGEFALIDRLRKAFPRHAPRDLIVGIGDDAAVWRADDSYAVATTDTMVEGVHFLSALSRPEEVGWKALASNISDIAAMGGAPRFALVTLCLPPDTDVSFVDGLYTGLGECADRYGVTVVGGDVVSSPVLTVTIALYGTAMSDSEGLPLLLRRDAARAGDAIAVTGTLGGSAGGLRAIKTKAQLSADLRVLAQRHLRPAPRIDAGRAAIAAGVRCAIDVSDGLVQDVGHVCESSGLDAEITVADVPVDSALVACYPDDALELALSGGEDYELVLVGPQEKLEAVRAQIDVPLTVIGRMLDTHGGRARLIGDAGETIELRAAGWDHFRREDGNQARRPSSG
jgi:thiamine-monophosphate kinase